MATEEQGYVFRSKLGADQIAEMFGKLFDKSAYALVRRVDDINFVSFDPGGVESLLKDWAEGQVFNNKAELRWRLSGEVYSVLLMTEEETLPPSFQPLTGSPYEVRDPSFKEDHGFLLWGTKLAQENWLETRIPRALQYPVQTSKKPRLAYRLYQEGAVVRWVRLRGLQGDK
jgi:hypothetical protein